MSTAAEYRRQADDWRDAAAEYRHAGDWTNADLAEFWARVRDDCVALAELGVTDIDVDQVAKGRTDDPRQQSQAAPAGASWVRVDLGPALRGEHCRVTPSILSRDDGDALLYAARVNGVHGDSGDGKSWAAAIALAQQLDAGAHAALIDFEDDETVIVERLRDVLGVDPDVIERQLHYYRPVEPFDGDAYELIAADVVGYRMALVVIDSLGEAFGLEGIDEDRDVQVAPWLRRVARALADLGPAVLLIDHSTKAKDNPLFPSGSKRKRAAITGASYLLEATQPLIRDRGGRLRLTCAKDRHGTYRRGEQVAVIDFKTYPDGGTSVKVWPPSPSDGRQKADERLRIVARAVLRTAKKAGRALSTRELLAATNIKAGTELRRAAIDHAVGVGALRIEAGPRNAALHVYVHDLEPETDAP